MTNIVDSLNIKLIPTYYIDWFTYAGDRSVQKTGLDEYIQYCYGFENTPELMETGNDTVHRFTVAKGKNDSDYDRLKLEEFKDDGGNVESWSLGRVLNDMCDHDWLPEGTYIVSYSY